MPRGVARDPSIKKYSAPVLRKWAEAFRDRARVLRREAEEMDAKAVRYDNRAIDLEKR